MELRRQREIKNLELDPIDYAFVSYGDDLSKATVILRGLYPPYTDGKFEIQWTFPPTYPFQPPKVKFITPIIHPNISKEGNVCVDFLSDQWTIPWVHSKQIHGISSLLYDANPSKLRLIFNMIGDHVNRQAAKLYETDPKKYNEVVSLSTIAFATDSMPDIDKLKVSLDLILDGIDSSNQAEGIQAMASVIKTREDFLSLARIVIDIVLHDDED
jgi:ubiquitin-protein ligase